MILTDSVKADILSHAAREYPRECCGLIIVRRGRQTYFPGRNISAGGSHFAIHPQDYLEADTQGEIVAVVHSHPDGTPDPSEADLIACKASGLPWVIVSHPAGKWREIQPEGYTQPLIGREFVHGTSDCFGLVRDWYAQNMNLHLPNFSREVDWWHNGQNLYLDNFASCGFVEIDVAELREGDALLMAISSPVPNHAAVYLGDGMILHHRQGRLSCREPLTGSYLNRTTHFLRYNRNL